MAEKEPGKGPFFGSLLVLIWLIGILPMWGYSYHHGCKFMEYKVRDTDQDKRDVFGSGMCSTFTVLFWPIVYTFKGIIAVSDPELYKDIKLPRIEFK